MTWHPYRLAGSELVEHLDDAVDATFADLTGQFMLMPRGDSFVTYEAFNEGYEALRTETSNFQDIQVANLWQAIPAVWWPWRPGNPFMVLSWHGQTLSEHGRNLRLRAQVRLQVRM